jgi:predicted transcriptional regulator
MMKSILLSIKPKYVELIASGEKTIEVRKTRPKIETPFKCYIYCTKEKKQDDIIWAGIFRERGKWNGRVIGEFICNNASELDYVYYWNNGYEFETCLTYRQVADYGKGKTLYGWHISDLKIYDKPKELSEFYTKKKCNSCKKSGYESTACMYDEDCKVPVSITRPPQSWMHVEDLGEEE